MDRDILAVIDEDDEEDGKAKSRGEEGTLKQQIREMIEEKRTRDDYLRRLERKVNKIRGGLSEVVEEEEGLRRRQDHEMMKKENEALTLRSELDSRANAQAERIRESLCEALYNKQVPAKALQYELDTVKVTNSRFLQPLAFRVDDTITVMKLRNNACKYWNVNPDDFILKTMGNNKCSDEIRVKECFKQGELAQLRLEEKRMEPSLPSEEELKAIQKRKVTKRHKHRAPRYNAEGIEAIQKHIDSYSSQLSKMGGIYFLLKLRDTKPSEHCAKIKLRDIIIYCVLLTLCWWAYDSRRPQGQDYWFVQGLETQFTQPSVRPNVRESHYSVQVPGFFDIVLEPDVWSWLKFTLPGIVWDDNGLSFSAYNLPIGYMSIRIKNVAAADPPFRFQECLGDTRLVSSVGGACYAVRAYGQSEGKELMYNITRYWIMTKEEDRNDPQSVRGEANPGVFVSAEENHRRHNLGTLTGLVDRYDAGGYSVHYRMDARNMTKARLQYAADMNFLEKAGWISMRTRCVLISFTVYNFDYDMWLASDFFFEMPPSGTVKTYTSIRPFKPRVDETRGELSETSMDIARIVIGIYILVFVGMNERRHKIKYHKAGIWYHFSLNGITDFGTVICIWVVVLWRFLAFRGDVAGEVMEKADKTYTSFSDKAWSYYNIFAVEGLVVIFLSLRMLSFLRLNKVLNLIWKTLGRAFVSFSFFTLMFVPAIIGFTIMLHSTYGAYMEEFTTIQGTLIQFYKVVQGDLNSGRLLALDSTGGALFLLFFYAVITFLLLNIFVAIVVDAYYVVQVTTGGPGEGWNLQKWYRWAVPSLLVNIIQAMFPSQHNYVENN